MNFANISEKSQKTRNLFSSTLPENFYMSVVVLQELDDRVPAITLQVATLEILTF